MSFKAIRIKNQHTSYAAQKTRVIELNSTIASLIESGDYSLAQMKADELSQALSALNKTANTLADTLT